MNPFAYKIRSLIARANPTVHVRTFARFITTSATLRKLYNRLPRRLQKYFRLWLMSIYKGHQTSFRADVAFTPNLKPAKTRPTEGLFRPFQAYPGDVSSPDSQHPEKARSGDQIRKVEGCNHPTALVIVPSFEAPDLLVNLLESFLNFETCRNYNLVVNLQGGNHKSVDVCQKYVNRLPLRIVRGKENLSYSNVCNETAKLFDHEVLIFLNNDITFTSSVVCRLASIASTTGVGAVGPLINTADPVSRQRTGTTVGENWVIEQEGLLLTRPTQVDFANLPPAFPSHSLLIVPSITAACLAISRDLFSDLNGFDNRYIYGREDSDLCVRISRLNLPIICDTATEVQHYESSTRRTIKFPVQANRELLAREHGVYLRARARLDDHPFLRPERTSLVFHCSRPETGGGGDLVLADYLRHALPSSKYDTRIASGPEGADSANPFRQIDLVLYDLTSTHVLDTQNGNWIIPYIRNKPHRWIELGYVERASLVLTSSMDFFEILNERAPKGRSFYSFGDVMAEYTGGLPDQVLPSLATRDIDLLYIANSAPNELRVLPFIQVPDGTYAVAAGRLEREVRRSDFPWDYLGEIPSADIGSLYLRAKAVVDDVRGAVGGFSTLRYAEALHNGCHVFTNGTIGRSYHPCVHQWNSSEELGFMLREFFDGIR